MDKYKPGTFVRHQDLNEINDRLTRLEKMKVCSPLTLKDIPGGRLLGIDQQPLMIFVELLENLPPFNCAKVSRVLYRPADEQGSLTSEDIDGESFSNVDTPPKEEMDESGFVRGHRDTWNMLVYDNFGIHSTARTRGWAIQHPDTYDGRYFFLPNYTGDQFFGTLKYADNTFKQFLATPPVGGNIEYVRFANKFNSNAQIESFRAYAVDASVGGIIGDGWIIHIKYRGIYHILANIYAERITVPAGADITAKINGQSQLRFTLQTKCSATSYVDLDTATLDVLPVSGRGGQVVLHAKNQLCHNDEYLRVRIEFVGAAGSGDWEIKAGGIHIQRYFHPAFDCASFNAINADGSINADILEPEGGYTETNEHLEGDYDADWVNADGADPPLHNSGYPFPLP